jgi:nucleoid-associated protein YgaU
MSPAKRVAYGVGIMLLGALAALPFRRDAALDPTLIADSGDNVLSLSQGVSLQMPGQQATVPLLPARPTPPSPNEETGDASQGDANPEEMVRSVEADVAALAKPPALPDQYRPLFKPATDEDRSGHVAAPAQRLRRHTIHDGDTLEGLAVRYLGDSQRAGEILELNRQVLADPQLLPIGVAISIPPRGPGSSGAEPADSGELVPLPTSSLPWNR